MRKRQTSQINEFIPTSLESAVPSSSHTHSEQRQTTCQRRGQRKQKTTFWHLQLVCRVLQFQEAVYNSPSCLSLTSPCLLSVMLSAAVPVEPLHLLNPPAKKHTLGSRQEERHLKRWAEQRLEFTDLESSVYQCALSLKRLTGWQYQGIGLFYVPHYSLVTSRSSRRRFIQVQGVILKPSAATIAKKAFFSWNIHEKTRSGPKNECRLRAV